MPMFEQNYENWYIWSQNGLLGPFWPLFRPKLVKMAQNHYFLASDAKLFPTRGHMPMFEKFMKIGIFGLKMACRAPKIINFQPFHQENTWIYLPHSHKRTPIKLKIGMLR